MGHFQFPSSNGTDKNIYVDYLRITDEDYDKVQVTYGDGAKLDKSVLVDVTGETFKFIPNGESTDLSGITITDKAGNEFTVFTAELVGGEVVITNTGEFGFNTEYTLTIPAALAGTEANQLIAFTTKWDETAEFDRNNDVIKHDPDLVFVEFAVNDSNVMDTNKWMESIVRNLNALEKRPVIIFVYTTVLDINTNALTISMHEELAEAYGIPAINLRDYVATRIEEDAAFETDWNNKVYLNDGTHQSAEGGVMYGGYVISLLRYAAGKYFVLPKSNDEVSPLTDYKDYIYTYQEINTTLTNGQSGTYNVVGDEMVLRFNKNPNGGIFTVKVGGNVIDTVDTYFKSTGYPDSVLTYTGLGEGTHSVEIAVTGQNEASTGSNVQLSGIYQIKGAGYTISAPAFNKSAIVAGEEITVTFEYNSEETDKVEVIVARYDSTGKFTGFVSEEKTLEIGEGKTMSIKVTPQAGDGILRAFCWNNLDDMLPLSGVTELK